MFAKHYYFILMGLTLLSSCGKSTSSATTSSAATTVTTPFATAIGSISSGVAATGAGLKTSAFTSSSSPSSSMITKTQALAEQEAYSFLTITPLTSTLCAAHGYPVEVDGTTSISQGDARYPFIHTYCAMTLSDGDTVRGGFDLVKGLICSLEKGGIAFAGATQSIAINFSDTTCWPTGGPGGATSGTLTATGTAPASFNTHFEKGVSFTYNDGTDTLTYKVAANITSTNIEFIAHESWTSGNTGVMAGEMNPSPQQATGYRAVRGVLNSIAAPFAVSESFGSHYLCLGF